MAQNRKGIHRMAEFSTLNYAQIKFALWCIQLNMPNAAHCSDVLIEGFKGKNPEWFRNTETA